MKRELIQIASLAASDVPMYSASTVENATSGCLWAHLDIALFPSVKTKLEVNFRSSRSPSKSESVKPIGQSVGCSGHRSVLYWIARSDVFCR